MNVENLLVVQGGGPTPVLNATLSSILKEASHHNKIGRIFGSKSGVAGIARGEIIDLDDLQPAELNQLRMTPGAPLGLLDRNHPRPTWS